MNLALLGVRGGPLGDVFLPPSLIFKDTAELIAYQERFAKPLRVLVQAVLKFSCVTGSLAKALRSAVFLPVK